MGNGNDTRNFTYVDDIVNGAISIVLYSKSNGQVFNIGNDEEISMTDLARKIIEITGKDTKIKHVNMAEADRSEGRDILFRRPDISKARELLGYSPQVCLDEGIRTLIEHGSIPDSWYEPMNYTKHGY